MSLSNSKYSSTCDFCRTKNFKFNENCAFPFLRIRVKLWRGTAKSQQKSSLQNSSKIELFDRHEIGLKCKIFNGHFRPCKKFDDHFRFMTNFVGLYGITNPCINILVPKNINDSTKFGLYRCFKAENGYLA